MNLTRRVWNRDYNLFQQDPVFDGLDAVHHDDFDFDNTTYEFLTKPVKIGETLSCKLTSLNKVFSEYLLVLENNQGYQIPLMVCFFLKFFLQYLKKINTFCRLLKNRN